MRRFTKKFIVPFVDRCGYSNLCEIGSQGGSNLDQLLNLKGVRITTIDPCIDQNLEEKYQGSVQICVKKGLSLEVLPTLSDAFDCIMIDGDHNWYSVFNELKLIHDQSLLAQGGSILFHDVHWPYARRDMYYDPDNIPAEFQQPRAKRGIIRGQVELASSEGQGKNADLWNALNEGGPRNGVLTAIEDFMNEHPSGYEFYRLHREWGLGVLTRKGQQPKGLSKLKLKGVWYNFISPIKIRLGLYDR